MRNLFDLRSAALLISLGAAVFVLPSCATTAFQPEPVVYGDYNLSYQVKRKYVDEDSPLENEILFRNLGREVMSFDYTIGDEPGVPHIDMDGPNSGLVENLYPGEEREVPNPSNLKAVYPALGRITRGKKSPEELDALYNPNPKPKDEGPELALLAE